jgi:Flp pilus assembly protein TadG
MLDKLIELWRRWWPDWQRGSLSVEVAIAAPVLITFVLGVADFGQLMNTAASLRGATRAGAEYAKANWNGDVDAATALQQTQQRVCGFLGLSQPSGSSSCSAITPTVTTSCGCADNTTVTCPTDGSNPCSGKSDPRLLISVVVGASQNFTPIVSWASFAFPSTVSASTTVRTQ